MTDGCCFVFVFCFRFLFTTTWYQTIKPSCSSNNNAVFYVEVSLFHIYFIDGSCSFYPLRTSRPNEYLPPGYLILLGTVIFPSQIIMSFKSMDCCMFCIIKQALSDYTMADLKDISVYLIGFRVCIVINQRFILTIWFQIALSCAKELGGKTFSCNKWKHRTLFLMENNLFRQIPNQMIAKQGPVRFHITTVSILAYLTEDRNSLQIHTINGCVQVLLDCTTA